MTKKSKLRNINLSITILILVSLAAVGSLFYMNSTYSGMVINTDMVSLEKQLCPDRLYPLPVFTEEIGANGNEIIKCVSGKEAIDAPGGLFANRRVGGKHTLNVPEAYK